MNPGAAATVTNFLGLDSRLGHIWKRLAGGAVWTLLGSLGWHGFTLLGFTVAARFLGKEQFGQATLVQNTLGMLGVLAGLGLGTTCTRYVAEFRTAQPSRLGGLLLFAIVASVLLSLAMGAAVLALTRPMAASLLNDVRLANALALGAALVFFNSVTQVLHSALSGFERFRSIAIINFFRGAACVCGVLLLVPRHGVEGMILALVAPAVIGLFLSAVALRAECRRSEVRLRFSDLPANARLLLTFSVPVFVIGTIALPVTWFVQAYLARQPHGYGELGLLNAALQWRNVITTLPAMLLQPALPILTSLLAAGQFAEYRALLRSNVRMALVYSVAATVPVSLFGGLILAGYGPGFAAGRPAFLLTSASSVFIVASAVIAQGVISAGWIRLSVGIHAAWALVAVAAAIPGARLWGATGAAAALLCAYAVQAVLFFWLTARRTSL
jgi:O-antigen/teichoic acid export membrane protein